MMSTLFMLVHDMNKNLGYYPKCKLSRKLTDLPICLHIVWACWPHWYSSFEWIVLESWPDQSRSAYRYKRWLMRLEYKGSVSCVSFFRGEVALSQWYTASFRKKKMFPKITYFKPDRPFVQPEKNLGRIQRVTFIFWHLAFLQHGPWKTPQCNNALIKTVWSNHEPFNQRERHRFRTISLVKVRMQKRLRREIDRLGNQGYRVTLRTLKSRSRHLSNPPTTLKHVELHKSLADLLILGLKKCKTAPRASWLICRLPDWFAGLG